MTKITYDVLVQRLNYNSETGIFTWKPSNYRTKDGSVAGTLKRDGYIVLSINKKQYSAHRLAWLYMTGTDRKSVV